MEVDARRFVATSLVFGLLVVSGCAREQVAEEQAAADAREQAHAAWRAADGSGEWKAGDLAREAARDTGVTLLDIAGVDTATPDGVTLTIKVVGTGHEGDKEAGWLGGGQVERELKLSFCYQLRFRSTRDVTRVTELACPTGQPVPSFSLPPPIDLPHDIEEQLRANLSEAPAGGPVDEAAARTVVEALNLDERVTRTVESGSDSVGIALRAYPRTCVLARITPDGIEIWRPPRVMQQPGELTCSADDAVRGLGQRPPH